MDYVINFSWRESRRSIQPCHSSVIMGGDILIPARMVGHDLLSCHRFVCLIIGSIGNVYGTECNMIPRHIVNSHVTISECESVI